MASNANGWTPFDPRSWARLLGLVHVPMFGTAVARPEGKHSVLLDGEASSFALSVTEDVDLVSGDEPLSWSWSANLRHSVIINEARSEMFLRRWDAPAGSLRRFRSPANARGAAELLAILEKAPAPRADDVILFVLRAFRVIRNSLTSTNGLDAIRVLNILLLGTDGVLRKRIAEHDWSHLRTVQDAVKCLSPEQISLIDADALSPGVLKTRLGSLFEYFLTPEPVSQCRLDPDLLLRHASGQLYQEAHFRLEREVRQMHLPDLAPETLPAGLLTKDVRFTPPVLARALVEQAFDSAPREVFAETSVEILDPACGSGVFLQEALRELGEREFRGKVTLRGFDTSPISCAIAQFCLGRAKEDARGIDVTVDVCQVNSLQAKWGNPDFILMNPPFVPWERMRRDEQSIVQQVLGPLATYRADIAMAFIWQAAQCLRENAVLASVLPAPLFETQSGREWREKLASTCDLLLLGRFEGYGFFRGSIVEPGVLVLRGKPDPQQASPSAIRVVIAKSGCEDLALRALRQKRQRSAEPADWDVFEIQRSTISSASWMPRFRHAMQRVEAFASADMPTVADLFHVRQGVCTGNNQVFVLGANEVARLPKRERTFFRPIASNSTIRDGTLDASEFVFYPYGPDGLLFPTEAELRARVRDYFTRYLEPNRKALAGRPSLRDRNWWELSERRPTWQSVPRKKIVSTYFGDRGSFAYDKTGEFVVLQGYGWLWRKPPGKARPRFEQSHLPWAYLALLNSRVFEDLLESFCPRVQGGQYNLSRRFVEQVYLPDLSDDLRVTGALVEELATIGRRIDAGQMPELQSLDALAARAFGLPLPD